MSKPLDTEVRDLLNARRGDWKGIATGSGVSYSWLSKFANLRISNPGYETLMKLLNHMHPAKRKKSPTAAPPQPNASASDSGLTNV